MGKDERFYLHLSEGEVKNCESKQLNKFSGSCKKNPVNKVLQNIK